MSQVIGPGNLVTRYQHDAVGRPTEVTRSDDRSVRFNYESFGRRLIVSPPGKPAHVADSNPESQTTRYAPPMLPGPSSERSARLDDDGLVANRAYGLPPFALDVRVMRD